METLILIPSHQNSTLALNIIWKIMLMQECALPGVAALLHQVHFTEKEESTFCIVITEFYSMNPE